MVEGLVAAAWVALGAAIGGPLRFFVSGLVGRRIGETFPWGTLAVNASGAFAIGCAAALAGQMASEAWLFIVTGLLGSYTTVSSFSLQTLALMRNGETLPALGNIAASLALCLAGVALGLGVGAALA